MELEWCSHCCIFSETRLSVLDQKPCNIISSSCILCGKILSDTSMPMLPLRMRIPNKRKKKTPRRMKIVRQPKHYVKAETSDLSSGDSNSVLVDPASKKEKQPIYSDSESSNF